MTLHARKYNYCNNLLKLVRTMIETLNLARKYAHIFNFRNFFGKNSTFFGQNSTFTQTNIVGAVLGIFNSVFSFKVTIKQNIIFFKVTIK